MSIIFDKASIIINFFHNKRHVFLFDSGLIGFVNCYSVSGATWVENALTVAKLTAIAIIIGGGLYNISQGKSVILDRLVNNNDFVE